MFPASLSSVQNTVANYLDGTGALIRAEAITAETLPEYQLAIKFVVAMRFALKAEALDRLIYMQEVVYRRTVEIYAEQAEVQR